MAEAIVIIIYVICNLIIGIGMLYSGKYLGELNFFRIGIDFAEVFVILLFTILGFVILYASYLITRNRKKRLLGLKFIINVPRFNTVFLFIVILQILFLLSTDVGRVGSNATSSLSFIFSILYIDALLGIYYLLCRDLKSKLFILNISLFAVLKLLQGWTAFVIIIAIYELYFYFKSKKKRDILDVFKVLSLPLLMILIGGKLYQYAYAFKFYIRDNVNLTITYFEGLVNLVSRLSFFPISIGAYERFESIKENYIREDVFLKEIQGVFKPFLPRFIMSDKEFRPLNNNVLQSFWSDISDTTSSNFGIIMYAKTLFQIDFIEGIIWLILLVTLLVFFRRLFNSFEQEKGQLDLLYFLLLLDVFLIGSLEFVFGYGYLRLLYMLPLLMIVGVIKIKKV